MVMLLYLQHTEWSVAMKDRTLQGFLRLYNSQHGKASDYMMVQVQVDDQEPELIINTRANFEEKMAYYAQAYDEDLTLKANPSVKIVDFDFFLNYVDLMEAQSYIL